MSCSPSLAVRQNLLMADTASNGAPKPKRPLSEPEQLRAEAERLQPWRGVLESVLGVKPWHEDPKAMFAKARSEVSAVQRALQEAAQAKNVLFRLAGEAAQAADVVSRFAREAAQANDVASRFAREAAQAKDVLSSFAKEVVKTRESWREWAGSIQARELARNAELLAGGSFMPALESLRKLASESQEPATQPSEELKAQAETAIQDIATAAMSEDTLQAAVDRIATLVQATKDPAVQAFMARWVYPLVLVILAIILSPIADHYEKRWLSESDQESTKRIKQRALNAARNLELLADRRFVTATVLQVHQNPRAQSPVVGQLRLGQTVEVLRMEKDFTLVGWTSRDEAVVIRGWVFSRYLSRFD
jgi:hypothetical protein